MLTTGNSWAIAAARAFFGALSVGMVAGLTAYAAANGIDGASDADALVSGLVTGGIAFFTVIGTRLGVEGYLDRNNPDAT